MVNAIPFFRQLRVQDQNWLRLIVEYYLPSLSKTSKGTSGCTKYIWIEKDKVIVECDSLFLRYTFLLSNLDCHLNELAFLKGRSFLSA